MLSPLLRGPGLAPLREGSLLEALEHRAAGDKPWLTFHHGTELQAVRASDVVRSAQAWAAGFVAAGVTPGARVGIWQPNDADFVSAFFGALGAGAIPVPLAWPVIEGQLGSTLARLAPLIDKAGIRHLAAPQRARNGDGRWVSPLAGAHAWPAQPTLDDAAFIQFTSGSTTGPRGAVISHRAALTNAHALVAGLKLGPDDLGVSWIPFFHDMGLIGVLLASLVGGFHVHVLRPSEFLMHPWRWLELIGETRATLTVGPDFGYSFAARRCGTRHFSLGSLRVALSGSEPIHLSTLDAFDARFGPEGFAPEALIGAYGLAENTLGVTVGPAREAALVTETGRHVPSVGAPLPGVELALSPTHEICVRSGSLFTGYFDDPARTAQSLRDGWLYTGDLGAVRDGRLFIVGREKELVIKGGTKFHPSEIEQLVALRADAPPNGVIAFNDADQLVLIIEQRRVSQTGDTGQIRALVADRLGVRVDRIEWVAAGTLPRTTSGKLQRAACAAQFGAPT